MSVKISTEHKNIATGETSEAITFFTSFTILISLNIFTSLNNLTSLNILTSITKKNNMTLQQDLGGGGFPLFPEMEFC